MGAPLQICNGRGRRRTAVKWRLPTATADATAPPTADCARGIRLACREVEEASPMDVTIPRLCYLDASKVMGPGGPSRLSRRPDPPGSISGEYRWSSDRPCRAKTPIFRARISRIDGSPPLSASNRGCRHDRSRRNLAPSGYGNGRLHCAGRVRLRYRQAVHRGRRNRPHVCPLPCVGRRTRRRRSVTRPSIL